MCLLCTFFYSICVGMLAFCLKGFKKFTHRCPRCNTAIGVTEPQLTRKDKYIIGGTVAAIAALIIILTVVYLTVVFPYVFNSVNDNFQTIWKSQQERYSS